MWKLQQFLGFLFHSLWSPLSQSYQFFLRKICIVSIKPNRTESKEKKKIDLLSNITLEVTTNFVSARLLQKPIRLKIKKQKTKKKTFLYNGLSCEKKMTVSTSCCINNDLSSSSSSSSSSISREPTAAAAAPILANAPVAAPVSVSASANAAQDWTVASSADRRDDKPALASSKGSLYFFKDEIFETFFFHVWSEWASFLYIFLCYVFYFVFLWGFV